MTDRPDGKIDDEHDAAAGSGPASEGEDNGSTEKDGEDGHLHEDQKSQSLPT